MSEEDAALRAFAIVAQTLAIEIVGALTQKKVLDLGEAKELFDRCLLNFETQQSLSATPEMTKAFEVARSICERAIAQIASQDQSRR